MQRTAAARLVAAGELLLQSDEFLAALTNFNGALKLDPNNSQAAALIEKYRDSEIVEAQLETIKDALMVYSPEYDWGKLLHGTPDLSKTRGKYVYLRSAHVFQALGSGRAIFTGSNTNDDLKVMVHATSGRFKTFEFRENGRYHVIGRCLGPTYYTTVLGAKQQALEVELSYVGQE